MCRKLSDGRSSVRTSTVEKTQSTVTTMWALCHEARHTTTARIMPHGRFHTHSATVKVSSHMTKHTSNGRIRSSARPQRSLTVDTHWSGQPLCYSDYQTRKNCGILRLMIVILQWISTVHVEVQCPNGQNSDWDGQFRTINPQGTVQKYRTIYSHPPTLNHQLRVTRPLHDTHESWGRERGVCLQWNTSGSCRCENSKPTHHTLSISTILGY